MAEPKKKDAKPEISQATKDLKKKLDSIVVKHLEFEETPFEGVLEACKVEALAGDPGKKGVNIFLIGISKETLEAKVNLVVDYLPLSELIEILCRMNGLQYKVEDNGVVILPAEPKPEDNFKDVKE